MTTVVPPDTGPAAGLTPVTSGAAVASSALHAVRSEVPANEMTVPEAEAPAAGGDSTPRTSAIAARGPANHRGRSTFTEGASFQRTTSGYDFEAPCSPAAGLPRNPPDGGTAHPVRVIRDPCAPPCQECDGRRSAGRP